MLDLLFAAAEGLEEDLVVVVRPREGQSPHLTVHIGPYESYTDVRGSPEDALADVTKGILRGIARNKKIIPASVKRPIA